jgi:polyhydroxybutyrate depolymerase
MDYVGLQRTYRLIVPASYDPAMPTPLVLALHGGGGSGEQMCTLPGGIQELAERDGFIVVCPDAVENHWNDGRGNQEYRSQAEDIDDVGFLLALIGRLSEDHNIDPARIYVTGASNGGMMTQRMACEASGAFAAAAVVIASQPENLDCEPVRPISILFMNGTDDPLMPYEGGEVHFYRQELGEVLSTQDAVSFWAGANGCDPAPETELLPDLDPEDGTRIRLDTYSGCDAGARVLLYTVQGGGHSWPGGSQYLPRSVIGRVSRDLHANEAIWGFFAAR